MQALYGNIDVNLIGKDSSETVRTLSERAYKRLLLLEVIDKARIIPVLTKTSTISGMVQKVIKGNNILKGNISDGKY